MVSVRNYCRTPRDNRRMLGVVMILSITSLPPMMKTVSWNLPTTTETNSPVIRPSRVETVFLDGQPFRAKFRTMYRHVPEFTDVTQSYPYTDSTDHDGQMERRSFPEHEHDKQCVPMSDWQTTFHPNCNEFHALDVPDALADRDFRMLSKKGYWRFAWEYVEQRTHEWTEESYEKYRHDQSVVIRTLKLEHDMEDSYFEGNRVDAIAMERLTKSPYVINMFGFCGMSVTTEFAGHHVGKVVDTLNSLEKLELAKMIAQGVADVHGIDGNERVSLVHNDLNFGNIVMTKNHSRPVINDFNVAVLMMKRNDTDEPCPFTSHYPNPQWRAPEEQVDENGVTSEFLTEKIDIYALGNVMFRFAVGHSPWRNPDGGSLSTQEKLRIASMKLHNGTLPDIPSEVRDSKDPAIQALLSVMRECYRHNPSMRPSAKKVVVLLEEAIDDYKAQMKETEAVGDGTEDHESVVERNEGTPKKDVRKLKGKKGTVAAHSPHEANDGRGVQSS